MRATHPAVRRASRGLSLIEALTALLVLSLGLLAVARLQPQLRGHADLARQRSEATRLAQQEIERLRAFATTNAVPGVPSFADIVDAERSVGADDGGSTTSYRIVRRVDTASTANARAVDVAVEWRDRAGETQSVRLASVIARIDPALSGALTLEPRGSAIAAPAARSIQIPLAAKDLGDGRSALKPTAASTEAWVFDNRSGALTQRCTGIAAAKATRDLATSDLSACTSVTGMMLSGEVHFSLAALPVAAAANDAPQPLAITLVLDGGTPAIAPWCDSEIVESAGQRYVAYRCVIVPPVGLRRWSGRTSVLPSGWAIGMTADERRVCRYAVDQDGSGAIDTNAEHPAIYQNVDRTLARQNFLVVRGDQACPALTEAHQPAP